MKSAGRACWPGPAGSPSAYPAAVSTTKGPACRAVAACRASAPNLALAVPGKASGRSGVVALAASGSRAEKVAARCALGKASTPMV
jgi:hypothetical protein